MNTLLSSVALAAIIAAPATEPSRISKILDEVASGESTVEEVIVEEEVIAEEESSTILGNIQQESLFYSNICEGGARVQYKDCWTGGYGIIQWTTVGRYDGLGRFAINNGCSASEFKCQLGYLVTEVEWKEALWRFKTPGKDVNFYMKGAYRWLGWGIYGSRGTYSYQYAADMKLNK